MAARKRGATRGAKRRSTGAGGTGDAEPRFEPGQLDRTVIAIPLVDRMAAEEARRAPGEAPPTHPVVIDLNLDFMGGREGARDFVIGLVADVVVGPPAKTNALQRTKYVAALNRLSPAQYVAATLTAEQLSRLVELDVHQAKGTWQRRGIYRIWPDFEVRACLTKSGTTVKADAARIAFNARGKGIVWAVMDSGIDARHPHFRKYGNLDLQSPVEHVSFLDDDGDTATSDEFGHGTHVAGIIAGCSDHQTYAASRGRKVYSAHGVREEKSEVAMVDLREVTEDICAIAPECKLVSMKVLDAEGRGSTTAIIRALQRVHEINQQGRRLLIHGENLSLGYQFEPEWFACGQSPLCVEVDRLVRAGVVVVVAAGNSGYGYQQTAFSGVKAAGLALTINDPGNAEQAITVGSTHREMPHLYGASFFSSKGPTGDGRSKPDLLAPGERILSCAAGAKKAEIVARERSAGSPSRKQAPDALVQYVEDSGTSMAAPHVSGAIAAFLSVRREFQGQPERVKALFLDNATDLNRDRYFQGRGLLDLMRTIQSI